MPTATFRTSRCRVAGREASRAVGGRRRRRRSPGPSEGWARLPHPGPSGKFALWTEGNSGEGPDIWAQVPKQENRQWILEVDGRRLVINEWSKTGTTPAQLAEMDAFLASVQIG